MAGRRGQGAMEDDPAVQFRTTQVAKDVVKTIADEERRSMKDQTELLIFAGAEALGYDVESMLNEHG